MARRSSRGKGFFVWLLLGMVALLALLLCVSRLTVDGASSSATSHARENDPRERETNERADLAQRGVDVAAAAPDEPSEADDGSRPKDTDASTLKSRGAGDAVYRKVDASTFDLSDLSAAQREARSSKAPRALVEALGLGDGSELVELRHNVDQRGNTHARYQQTYRGMPIDICMRFNNDIIF